MVEEKDPIEDFRKRIGASLVIKRVPTTALEEFKSFANEKFAGDYGMLLMFYQDFYHGLIPSGLEPLEAAVEQLMKDVDELKRTDKKEEKKEDIKMGDGRVIKRS